MASVHHGPNNDGLICPIHKCCWLMIDRMLDLNIGHGYIYIYIYIYIWKKTCIYNLYFMQTHSMDLWIYIYIIYILYSRYKYRFHVKIRVPKSRATDEKTAPPSPLTRAPRKFPRFADDYEVPARQWIG